MRKNQLSGYVCIDKAVNKHLKDLSNRQGLNEDTYYSLFIKILEKGINEFERYRQSIIRKIAARNAYEQTADKAKVLDAFKKNPRVVKELDETDLDDLLLEVEEIESSKKESEEKLRQHEERYRYDVRILNTLSTVGLKASSMAHELRNKRNFIYSSYPNIVNALKEYGLWEELNKPEHTRIETKNVPVILSENNKVSKQLLVFLDTLLSDIEKGNFFPQIINTKEAIYEVTRAWEADYPWISIDISGDEKLECLFPKDVISVIFDNLILNSIQQNDNLNHLDIEISFTKDENNLFFTYMDNGKGLCEAYINDPFLILEPHESSRENGHGLGMWIIYNTIDILSGAITDIPTNQNGFKIEFMIKEVQQ